MHLRLNGRVTEAAGNQCRGIRDPYTMSHAMLKLLSPKLRKYESTDMYVNLPNYAVVMLSYSPNLTFKVSMELNSPKFETA